MPVDHLLRRALDVGVLDAQHEHAAVTPREQPVEERRAGAADVEVAGGRRREADAREQTRLTIVYSAPSRSRPYAVSATVARTSTRFRECFSRGTKRHRSRNWDDAKMARMRMGLVSYADLQRMARRRAPVPSCTTARFALCLHQRIGINSCSRSWSRSAARIRAHARRPPAVRAVGCRVHPVQRACSRTSSTSREARRHLVQLDKPTDAAPDLTIEILSPGTSTHDRMRKQAMYARFGVREYWIVDPVRRDDRDLRRSSGDVYRLAQIAGR